MTTEDPRMMWRIALVGAVSALIGSGIGAGTAVGIDVLDAHRTTIERVRELKDAVYKRALAYERSVVGEASLELGKLAKQIYDPKSTPVPTPTAREKAYAVAKRGLSYEDRFTPILDDMALYGSTDAIERFSEFETALLESLVAEIKGSDASPAHALMLKAMDRLTETVRAEVV
jgi:hypothetical protein